MSDEKLKPIQGKPAAFPLATCKATNLIYYDGVLLAHLAHPSIGDYLITWVDCDTEFNRWVIYPVTKVNLYGYLNKELTLYDLLHKNKSVLMCEIDKDVLVQNCRKVKTSDLPPDYVPDKDSYYTFGDSVGR